MAAARPSDHGLDPRPGQPDHPARTRLGDQGTAVGVEGNADRIEQAGRECLDVARSKGVHATGAEFGEHDHVARSDRHTVKLVEVGCEVIGFVGGGPVSGHLATRRCHDELSRTCRGQTAKEAGVAGREEHSGRFQ